MPSSRGPASSLVASVSVPAPFEASSAIEEKVRSTFLHEQLVLLFLLLVPIRRILCHTLPSSSSSLTSSLYIAMSGIQPVAFYAMKVPPGDIMVPAVPEFAAMVC